MSERRGPDPLTADERACVHEMPRPRRALPLAAQPTPRPELASEARPVDRADRPVHAVWELTLACDLACRHCGSRAGAARPDELGLAEALDLAGQLAELGVREVTLIGGEAYLYPGWTEVIAEIRRLGMQCTMVTGGRGLTPERAEAARRAGLQSLAVSIDGGAASHDRLRGLVGAHEAAVRGLHVARAAGLPVAANTQLNRLSMPDLPEVLDLLIDAGAHGWQLQLTVPMGRAADEPEVLLQPYDLLALFPSIAELKPRCDAARIKLLIGNNLGYFGPYDHLLRWMYPRGHSSSCPAGRFGIGVEANGEIKGCPSLSTDQWAGGNVREHRLREIWERSARLRFNRDRTVEQLWGYCRQCYYAEHCQGGCTWTASAIFGKPGNNPYCHHRALELARQGQRERIVRVAEAPGTPFDHAKWDTVLEAAVPAAVDTAAARSDS